MVPGNLYTSDIPEPGERNLTYALMRERPSHLPIEDTLTHLSSRAP